MLQHGQHYVNVSPRRGPTKLHAGWLEHKSATDSKWKWYWCVLRGNVIHIFKNETDSQEQSVGTLFIDSASRFEKKEGDNKTGYKFVLHTGRRINKFRTKKFSDREHWRAFFEGISKGHVSDTIDLPEKLIEDIRKVLTDPSAPSEMPSSGVPPAAAPPPRPHTLRRVSDGTLTMWQEGFDVPDSPRVAQTSNSKFNTLPSMHTIRQQSPPSALTSPQQTMNDKIGHHVRKDFVFYTDPSKKSIPSWFFKDCSRELAKEVLIKSAKQNLGNTLMRSKPKTQPKEMVISKMLETGGSTVYSHYQVRSVPGGYMIILDEPHPPVKSLEDLMNFFKLRSGTATTKLLTSNDLMKWGIDPNPYYIRDLPHVRFDDENGELLIQASEVSLDDNGPSYVNTCSAHDSKGSSADSAFSIASSSASCSSQHSSFSLPLPPTPPPIPPNTMLANSDIPPKLPPNHPPTMPKSKQKVHEVHSNASSQSRPGPAVRPKPKKSQSFDDGIKSLTDKPPASIIDELNAFWKTHGNKNATSFKNASSPIEEQTLPHLSPDEEVYDSLEQYEN